MKEENQINQKQQHRFFVVEFLALAFLFGLLGILVSHFFESSVYSNIDQNIVHQQKMVLLRPAESIQNNDQLNPGDGGTNSISSGYCNLQRIW
ncbi:hypothetical protein [Lentilactobacillus senioris]|uniref:hypothetical protein n=1 Tax=Lentilactobacillus senioris TaxID=931534 RepID=UPI0006CFCEB0|nr:hypothetical protein [Lentilactobacillus senioris]